MARLKVEVAHATRGEQVIVAVELEAGATVRDALEAIGIAQRFPGFDASRAPLGIFGRRVKPDTPVKEGDRVEIYRPLEADPKEARRAKAAARRRARR